MTDIQELESPTQGIANQAAALPHPVTGMENCTACHGIEGIRPYPADHVGRANEICLGCHAAPPTPTPTSTSAATLTPGPKTTATPGATVVLPTAQTPKATSAGAPPVPHSLEGRERCLLCHDLESIKPFPEDHQGRSEETCLTCHTTDDVGGDAADTPGE
ncbi:MAG: cytochrome c3 family protein [Anaerolineae bacterium]